MTTTTAPAPPALTPGTRADLMTLAGTFRACVRVVTPLLAGPSRDILPAGVAGVLAELERVAVEADERLTPGRTPTDW